MFAHAYRYYCHAIHHVCLDLSYRFGSHTDSISSLSAVETNTSVCHLSVREYWCGMFAWSSCISARHRSFMVSYFSILCVYLKRALFHYVTGDGTHRMRVYLWFIEACKSFLGLGRYWILCFLVRNVICLMSLQFVKFCAAFFVLYLSVHLPVRTK
jgi:hypothetical protein